MTEIYQCGDWWRASYQDAQNDLWTEQGFLYISSADGNPIRGDYDVHNQNVTDPQSPVIRDA